MLTDGLMDARKSVDLDANLCQWHLVMGVSVGAENALPHRMRLAVDVMSEGEQVVYALGKALGAKTWEQDGKIIMKVPGTQPELHVRRSEEGWRCSVVNLASSARTSVRPVCGLANRVVCHMMRMDGWDGDTNSVCPTHAFWLSFLSR